MADAHWTRQMDKFNISKEKRGKIGKETSLEIWLAISHGELDCQSAIMEEKYTVEGDFTLLITLNNLFKG